MKLKTYTLAVALFLIMVSCTKNEEKEKEIRQLQQKFEFGRITNKALEEKNQILERGIVRTDSIIENFGEDSTKVYKEYLDFLADKSKIVKFLKDSIYDEDNNYILNVITDGYYTNSIFYKPNEEGLFVKNRFDFIVYILNTFDRSTDNIKNFFSESDKKKIYALFEDNRTYEESGASTLVSALLAAYDDVKNMDNKKFAEAEKILYTKETSTWDYLKTCNPGGVFYDVISDKVKQIQKDSKIIGQQRYAYVYSFWVRRIHENNAEAVYDLLAEMHQKLAKYVRIEMIKPIDVKDVK